MLHCSINRFGWFTDDGFQDDDYYTVDFNGDISRHSTYSNAINFLIAKLEEMRNAYDQTKA